MSRPVSAAFIAACNAPQTEDGFLLCVTIEHSELPAPIRLVTNAQNVVRTIGAEQVTFLACPLQAKLSDDTDDRPPQARLIVDNIDRRMVAAVRTITSPPTVKLEVVKISDPDTVEAEFSDFELKEVTYDALTIEGALTLEGLFQEPAVGWGFTPGYFPGLF